MRGIVKNPIESWATQVYGTPLKILRYSKNLISPLSYTLKGRQFTIEAERDFD